MKTTEFIKANLISGKDWLISLIVDMKDAPLTQPTSNGGNHPLWVLGHVIHSESDLLDVFLLGKPNRFPELENCQPGSQPTTNASDYLTVDQLLVKFDQIRADSLKHLATLSDDDLDQKSHAPPEHSEPFGTVGKCYAAMIVHMAFHAGQVADARRAAGRGPLVA